MNRHSPIARRTRLAAAVISAFVGLAFTPVVQAADWSDTALSVRYGSNFAEPYDNDADGKRKDIKKVILAFTNASGFKYGTTFVNIDFLQSDKNDPGYATTEGAQEVYGVFRGTFDIGKIMGRSLAMGPVRGYGVTAGMDINTKNDSYGSKKRLLVAGPTVMFDVPGFLNLSALLFDESNAPNNMTVPRRYHYKNHMTLEADWGIAVGSLPLSFNGYAQWIAAKGRLEGTYGAATGEQSAPETHLDAELMLDVGAVAGFARKTALVGVEYEYWHNKFGNSDKGAAGEGATASTPMVRLEYHF